MDGKFYQSFFVYTVSYKTLIGGKPLRIRFDKVHELIRVYMELDIQHYLTLKNVLSFSPGLDIL